MPKKKDIAPQQCVHMVAHAMSALGFKVAFVSDTGSRYLKLDKLPFQVRISDHQFSKASRWRQAQVVKSYAIREPMKAKEIPLLALEIAIGYVACVRRRYGRIGAAA